MHLSWSLGIFVGERIASDESKKGEEDDDEQEEESDDVLHGEAPSYCGGKT